MMDNPADRKPQVSGRVIAMLVALVIIISASVVGMDLVSPRDRHPTPQRAATESSGASLPTTSRSSEMGK